LGVAPVRPNRKQSRADSDQFVGFVTTAEQPVGPQFLVVVTTGSPSQRSSFVCGSVGMLLHAARANPMRASAAFGAIARDVGVGSPFWFVAMSRSGSGPSA
jgi:hypothetical protein